MTARFINKNESQTTEACQSVFKDMIYCEMYCKYRGKRKYRLESLTGSVMDRNQQVDGLDMPWVRSLTGSAMDRNQQVDELDMPWVRYAEKLTTIWKTKSKLSFVKLSEKLKMTGNKPTNHQNYSCSLLGIKWNRSKFITPKGDKTFSNITSNRKIAFSKIISITSEMVQKAIVALDVSKSVSLDEVSRRVY